MSSFTSPLIVTPMPDGRRWKLHSSFVYHVGSKHSRFVIKVPKGFITDFASIPWVLWTFLPSWGRYGKGAVVHDFLYQTHKVSRHTADLIFYEAMLVSKTPKWKARLMFWGVRLFGCLAWH